MASISVASDSERTTVSFLTPPEPRVQDARLGAKPRLRRLGVEIEFSCLDVRAAADIVESLFGGVRDSVSPHVETVSQTEFGDFKIELDASYAQPQGDETDWLRDTRELLGDIVSTWLPTEIATPPIPLDCLDKVEDLADRLAEKGASGTGESDIYAFALQLNPEASTLSTDSILATLKAYLILERALARAAKRDPLRRALPFSRAFPPAYVLTVLATGDAPELSRLIDDYLVHNPTRNRSLDMLPLFTHIEPERVRARIDDPRIKARPAWHYRMPDCRIDRGGTGIAKEWNRWVAVERLAADRTALDSYAADWRTAYRDGTLDALMDRLAEEWLSCPTAP